MICGRITECAHVALSVALVVVPLRFAFAESSQTVPALKASRLIGLDVENPDGQELGKLKDLVFDAQTGRLKYVLLTSGGVLGFGAKLRAVPPQLLSAATAKREILALNVTKTRWQNAPCVKTTRIASLADPAQEREIAQYYEPANSKVRMARMIAGRKGANGRLLAPTGHAAERRHATSSSSSVKLASDLIKNDVFDQRQEKLGEVLDLLIDFREQSPVLIVFSSGKLFPDRERAYVAAPRDFDFTGRKVVVKADRQSLMQARPFGSDAWESANTNNAAAIFRYLPDDSASADELKTQQGARGPEIMKETRNWKIRLQQGRKEKYG